MPSPMLSPSGSSLTTPTNVTKPTKSKKPHFVFKHGSKLHAYDKKEAPYPLSYDREVLDLWAMDHALISRVKDVQTFIDFKDKPPKRCLDLGTMLGDWVISCANHWPECTFVGFDLVDLQIPLKFVPSSVASRIEWVHGNFLTNGLPFPDNEFDHVHMEGVALAVPEDKWEFFFDELHRVMKPGGTVEVLQEGKGAIQISLLLVSNIPLMINTDAVFPILPKWFTQPLHMESELILKSVKLGPNSSQTSLLNSDGLNHDHALLEFLFYAVFENRFINPTPSSILPLHFSSTFRHVLSPPLLSFPTPPVAPLLPLPGEHLPRQLAPTIITSDPLDPSCCFLPERKAVSLWPNASTVSLISLSDVDPDSPEPAGVDWRPLSVRTDSRLSPVHEWKISTDDASTYTPSTSSSSRHSHRLSLAVLTSEESTQIGDDSTLELIPVPKFRALEEKMLYMQLYRAVGNVFAIKEAMWEELLELVRKGDQKLKKYGFRESDYDEVVARKQFDKFIKRYKDDTQNRLSLWYSLSRTGWDVPDRSPLSPGELAEETRLRKMILEARKTATEDDFKVPARTIRLLVGVKGDKNTLNPVCA